MNWKNFIKNKNSTRFLAICLIVGIIFLFLSEYSDTNSSDAKEDFDPDAYTLELESRLEEMLDKMEGVSEAKVMVTLDSGLEYRYSNAVEAGSGTLFPSASLSDGNALIAAVGSPRIKGVCVVCRGAANDKTRLRITRLVSSTLNLPEHQIYVTE